MRRVSEPRKEEVEGTKKGVSGGARLSVRGGGTGANIGVILVVGLKGWEVGNESVCTSASRSILAGRSRQFDVYRGCACRTWSAGGFPNEEKCGVAKEPQLRIEPGLHARW